MRLAVPVALLLVSLALAGCTQDDALPRSSPIETTPTQREEPFRLDGHPEFCESEASCDFWDEMYHQYVVYDLDTTIIDVVVVPPVGPDPLAHIDAAALAVKGWRDGIAALAAPWFNESFVMNVYVVGQDVPSVAAVEDPEIIVASAAALGVLGIGLEPKQIGCTLLDEVSLRDYPTHAHHGMQIIASECTGTGFTCFAINFGSIESHGLYDLVAHEVGHCLGAGHVGDALDFRARYAPVKDIMSYQTDPDHVHCVSNMDVRTLEGVYAHLLDRPEDEWLPRGSFLEFPPAEYMQVGCRQP